MATMNVSLPDPMKAWVENQAKGGRHVDASDYVRNLIRRNQDHQQAITELQALAIEEIESGPAQPVDVAAVKARMRARHGRT